MLLGVLQKEEVLPEPTWLSKKTGFTVRVPAGLLTILLFVGLAAWPLLQLMSVQSDEASLIPAERLTLAETRVAERGRGRGARRGRAGRADQPGEEGGAGGAGGARG
eukprot:gnl/MRDRNA2_/MRDRNA2_71345_c0_seq1.p1 gnl/MRDRNA2_/MRDRNA2_71345_c0~~gnl/MRDRNA2_/MRDRNA2_71345_c0_seq1.p1  ORF type:complete len:107 (+),score=18.74 gnl/MRDRNA2_/MRDRNA2_71345_c0_seq1:152-472(+)